MNIKNNNRKYFPKFLFYWVFGMVFKQKLTPKTFKFPYYCDGLHPSLHKLGTYGTTYFINSFEKFKSHSLLKIYGEFKIKKLSLFKVKFIFLTLIISFMLNYNFSQQIIPLETFYKQQFLKYSRSNSFETFYPVNTNYFNLHDSIKDTTTFYYDFHVWFFNRNWLEKKEKNGSIEINPLVNFSYGKGSSIKDSLPLYRNTRGVSVRGELNQKIFYSFVFCENQSRFMDYQNQYFNDRGELYDLDTFYNKVNAVIPAGARTKPFKTNGYDYAFSFGSFAYQFNSKVRLEGGNNQQFIGSGFRSLLLSDNAIYSPYLRFYWKLSEKFTYQIIYKRLMNLYRKPATLAVESSYEKKLFAANYLTYKPVKNFSISLFTSGNQLLTDSISKHNPKVQMLLPLPFMNNDFILKNKLINGISGINLDFALENSKYYAQIANDLFENKALFAFQIGTYVFDVAKIKNLNFQIELNYVPENFYADNNPKLAYSSYNLNLAHTKGNNFTEIFTHLNYEFKRVYFSTYAILYLTEGGSISKQIEHNSIFLVEKDKLNLEKGSTLLANFEIGYRINRKYNPTIYFQYQNRSSNFQNTKFNDNSMMFGLKVNLFNQYLDF
jgi:hypothetical protein